MISIVDNKVVAYLVPRKMQQTIAADFHLSHVEQPKRELVDEILKGVGQCSVPVVILLASGAALILYFNMLSKRP
jgi:hypothetical protein